MCVMQLGNHWLSYTDVSATNITSFAILFLAADQSYKNCSAGSYRTRYNKCEVCPIGTWSGDGETRCKNCADGQYEVNRKVCSNCPAGTSLNSRTCKNYDYKCKPCGKGKV